MFSLKTNLLFYFFETILKCWLSQFGRETIDLHIFHLADGKEFDKNELQRSQFQRVYQYLVQYDTDKNALNRFDYNHKVIEERIPNVLKVLIK